MFKPNIAFLTDVKDGKVTIEDKRLGPDFGLYRGHGAKITTILNHLRAGYISHDGNFKRNADMKDVAVITLTESGRDALRKPLTSPPLKSEDSYRPRLN